MEDMHEAELRAHYELGEERDRLAAGHGVLEFVRTTEIVLRHLPPAPARVADVGGGPGRYALWLAELGYEVEHRDLMPLHVRQVEDDAVARGVRLRTAVGDARDLDLGDASVDAVLLLGPLYHLRRRADRSAGAWRGPAGGAAGRAGVRGRYLALGTAAGWRAAATGCTSRSRTCGS